MNQLHTIDTPFHNVQRGYAERAKGSCFTSRPYARRGDPIVTIAKLFEISNFVTFDQIRTARNLSKEQIVQIKPELEAFLRKRTRSRVSVTSRVDLDPPGLALED